MTRDELLLAALLAGESTTADLMRSTGVGERNCRYGLDRLIAAGYVWSPQRGRWRITAAGRAIASALPGLPVADESSVVAIAVPVGEGATANVQEPAGPSLPPADPSGIPAWLGWALTGIAAAVALVIARRLPIPLPPVPPSAPPTVWPYDGWHIGGPS